MLIPAARAQLEGSLILSPRTAGLVLFAHGSGSGRHSPRNRQVARVLQESGIGTLLFDLLSEAESKDRANVFDIPLLAARLKGAAEWSRRHRELAALPQGYFGASTGAAAALLAAAGDPAIRAVVSRGGRPDLAGEHLAQVAAPTLLIVGGADEVVLNLNREALAHLQCAKELVIVPAATHLFEEPGALEQVAHLSAGWFRRHLSSPHVP